MASSSGQEFSIHLKNGLQVFLHNEDIFRVSADALAFTENGVIARKMEAETKNKYSKQIERSFYQGEVRKIDSCGILGFKCVFVANIGIFETSNADKWKKDLKTLYGKVLRKAEAEKLKSLTLPVFGTGYAGGRNGGECISILIRSLDDHKPKKLNKVNIVSRSTQMHQYLGSELLQYSQRLSNDKPARAKNTSSSKADEYSYKLPKSSEPSSNSRKGYESKCNDKKTKNKSQEQMSRPADKNKSTSQERGVYDHQAHGEKGVMKSTSNAGRTGEKHENHYMSYSEDQMSRCREKNKSTSQERGVSDHLPYGEKGVTKSSSKVGRIEEKLENHYMSDTECHSADEDTGVESNKSRKGQKSNCDVGNNIRKEHGNIRKNMKKQDTLIQKAQNKSPEQMSRFEDKNKSKNQEIGVYENLPYGERGVKKSSSNVRKIEEKHENHDMRDSEDVHAGDGTGVDTQARCHCGAAVDSRACSRKRDEDPKLTTFSCDSSLHERSDGFQRINHEKNENTRQKEEVNEIDSFQSNGFHGNVSEASDSFPSEAYDSFPSEAYDSFSSEAYDSSSSEAMERKKKIQGNLNEATHDRESIDKKKEIQNLEKSGDEALKTCPHCNGYKEGFFQEDCGHVVCIHCTQISKKCPDDLFEPPTYLKGTESDSEEDEIEPVQNKYFHQKPTCPICMDEICRPKELPKCGHVFCTKCIDDCFRYHKPVCPSCGTIYGILRGCQPRGTMTVKRSFGSLEGCERDINEHWEITYDLPSGLQKEEHPHPGKPYHGARRVAYLPCNREGDLVCKLLVEAFHRKLIFTIGRSTTTGREDIVTWNDVHHKTSKYGGPERYGYPDPGYLTRVREELSSKGVTEQCVAGVRLRRFEMFKLDNVNL